MSRNSIDHILEETKPTLTEAERSSVWVNVAREFAGSQPMPSPYMEFLRTYIMNPFVILFMCIVGGTSSAAAIDRAKPGDVLFPLEQITDTMRLTFSSAEHSRQLHTSFATERLSELRAILDEEAIAEAEHGTLALATTEAPETLLIESEVNDTAEVASFSMMAKMAAPMPTLTVVAEVFTDITIVTITQDGAVTNFMTKANTRDALAVEVATLQGLDVATVEAALVLETEERASRPSERGDVIPTSKGEARVGKAVNVLIDQLDTVDDEVIREQLIAELLHEINGVKVSRESSAADAAQNNRIQINNKHVIVGEDGYYRYLSDEEEEGIDDFEYEQQDDTEDNKLPNNQPEVKGESQSSGKHAN